MLIQQQQNTKKINLKHYGFIEDFQIKSNVPRTKESVC